VVGNDNTFLKAVDAVVKGGATLGIIPIGEENSIADNLGVPHEERACEVLAARKIVDFDLGQVGENFFFSTLKISKNIDRLTINHQGYRVTPRGQCSEVAVYNAPLAEKKIEGLLENISAQDGKLDLVFKSSLPNTGWNKYFTKEKEKVIDSVIQGVNFEIKSFEYLPVMLDDYKVIKTPIAVKLGNKKIRVIVGKSSHAHIN
jgi:hypothetical protein